MLVATVQGPDFDTDRRTLKLPNVVFLPYHYDLDDVTDVF